MEVGLFDYDLPDHLIAQTPLTDRTKSRLLTLNKETGQIEHTSFEQLIDYLSPGDVLVLNDTKVLPARLFGVKSDTGAKVELLLLKSLGNDRWEALVRPGKRVRKGSLLQFGQTFEQSEAPMLTAVVEEEGEMGARVVRFQYKGIFNEILDCLGQMPLPPYIKEQLGEKDRYQTVYAKNEGSSAAPTAGLHFTKDYLERLRHKGIRTVYVTLHVGLGTFRPVSVQRVEEHEMHAEYYELSQETADAVNEARRSGARVIAVGTTSARTLETAARAELGRRNAGENVISEGHSVDLTACSGWTDIFIYPGIPLLVVDALLTNFHLPKSTLMMLISALAGREAVLRAYREAVEREYRFFSFGDAMFIY